MKTCKKALAIFLCFLMATSCSMLSAFAEDVEPELVRASVSGIRATKFDAADPEKVLQLQMNVSASAALDAVDPAAQVAVYENLYITAYTFIAKYLEKSEEQMQAIKASAQIATLKPVSLENGILTLDVYSKDGAAGAKMISFTLPFLPSEELRQQGFNAFLFDFPQGMLKSSATGALTESFSATEMVTGLASREVRLPSWAEKIVSAFVSGDTSALFKLLPMVPLILLFAPLFIRSVASKVQKAYNAYGISLNDLVKDASKAIRKLIPTLLSQLS